MALPGSGPISFAQVNTELQRSATAALSLNDSGVRSLAGVGSGAIAMSQLYGKSNVSWSKAAGDYTEWGRPSATWNVTCNKDCVWTWTRSGTGTVTPATSGSTSTSLTFTVIAPSNTTTRQSSLTLTGTSNGVSRSWTVTLTGYGQNVEIDI